MIAFTDQQWSTIRKAESLLSAGQRANFIRSVVARLADQTPSNHAVLCAVRFVLNTRGIAAGPEVLREMRA